MKKGIFEVRGAAGAGKTYQLTSDIRLLHKKLHKRIAVISFSNSAVDELSSRIGNAHVTLSTIHSFCWKIIGAISGSILESAGLLSDFKPEGLDKHPEKTLENVKFLKYGQIGIPQFIASTGELWLSHNDVIELFVKSLESIPNLDKIISNSFDFILIDEYQDTDGDFLNVLFRKLSELLVIGIYGDPLQSIYMNERTLNISKARDNYGIKTYVLPNNYRSQSNLVDMYNDFRRDFDGLKQSAQMSPESFPTVFVHDGEITPKLVSEINSKMKFQNSVVLSITNGLRMKVVGANKIAKKILKWIPISQGSYTGWSEVLQVDRLSPYVEALIEYGNLLFGSNYDSVTALFKLFTKESIERVGLSKVGEFLNKKKTEEKIDYRNYINLGLEFNDEAKNIQIKFNEFKFHELSDVIKFYGSLNEINLNSMTIFHSKGLEFENVILNIDYGNFFEKNWNLINFDLKETDERNLESDVMSYLFYVGITRAKHGLVIYINKKEHPKFETQIKDKFISLKKI